MEVFAVEPGIHHGVLGLYPGSLDDAFRDILWAAKEERVCVWKVLGKVDERLFKVLSDRRTFWCKMLTLSGQIKHCLGLLNGDFAAGQKHVCELQFLGDEDLRQSAVQEQSIVVLGTISKDRRDSA